MYDNMIKGALGDKDAFKKFYKETEKIQQDQKRIQKITTEIEKIMEGLKV